MVNDMTQSKCSYPCRLRQIIFITVVMTITTTTITTITYNTHRATSIVFITNVRLFDGWLIKQWSAKILIGLVLSQNGQLGRYKVRVVHSRVCHGICKLIQ